MFASPGMRFAKLLASLLAVALAFMTYIALTYHLIGVSGLIPTDSANSARRSARFETFD
jgi:hypothetical protein